MKPAVGRASDWTVAHLRLVAQPIEAYRRFAPGRDGLCAPLAHLASHVVNVPFRARRICLHKKSWIRTGTLTTALADTFSRPLAPAWSEVRSSVLRRTVTRAFSFDLTPQTYHLFANTGHSGTPRAPTTSWHTRTSLKASDEELTWM